MGKLVTTMLICAIAPAVADLYADLGLTRGASADAIKNAYRSLAKQHHPDKSDAPDAPTKFAKIAAAYETLSDPQSRRLYDAYGPEYASRAGARASQQRDPFAEFFQAQAAGGRGYAGGGAAARASFPSTLELDQDNFDWFVNEREHGEVRLWLLLFYSDSSDLCRRFEPQWAALAKMLHPMIRLGRVNTDSRNTWGLVRRYRSLINRLPTVVMSGDDGGETARATAYYGYQLSAEVLAEWCRRFFPPAAVQPLGSARALSEFVKRHARTPGEAAASSAEAPVPVLVLSAQPGPDSLLFRYLSYRFVSGSQDGGVVGGNGGARVALAHAHVAGGSLGGTSGGAAIARTLGVVELPALAIWRDGPDRPPEMHSLGPAPAGARAESAAADADAAAVGVSGEAAQRARLVRLIQARARPRLRKLRASNLADTCGQREGCVLIVCGRSALKCAAAAALARGAEALSRAEAVPAEAALGWAIVDGVRQAAFAAALLRPRGNSAGGDPSPGHACSAAAGAAVGSGGAAPVPPLDDAPSIVLAIPAAGGRGLSGGRRAVYSGLPPAGTPTGEQDARALLAWLRESARGRDAAGFEPLSAERFPPLLADRPPGIGAWAWSLTCGNGLTLASKAFIALIVSLFAIAATLAVLGAQPGAGASRGAARGGGGGGGGGDGSGRAGARTAGPAGEARSPAGAREPAPAGSGSGGGESAQAGREAPSQPSAPAADPPALRPPDLASALRAAPYCIVLPKGSDLYSSSGCLTTARIVQSRYAAENFFAFSVLDLHEDDCGNVVFRHLQLVLRQCGCVALRRTAEIERTRVAVYGGPMAPDALNDWLDRLVRGEIPLAPLLES